MNKQANIQKAISLMKSKGMSAEQALKAVYPDWDEAQIKKAAMTIRTMDKTAAVMQVSSAMAELDKTSAAKKVTFSPAMDKSPLLKGKQSKLPDQIQAKILKGKLKKEKTEKTAGVSLTALRYASNAMYASHIEKVAGMGKEAMFGLLPSVAQYGTRGAALGGLGGAGMEFSRLMKLLTPEGRAATQQAKTNLLTAERAAGKKGVTRVAPWQKADPNKGQVGFMNNAVKDQQFATRMSELKGAGGFAKNPMEYVKLFAPRLMGSAATGAAAGGAVGTGAGAIAKGIAKRRMMDTAKKVAVPAALGLGGLAVLS